MNMRCAFCQTPYTLSRIAMLDALQEIDSQKLTHYDAHCPRCRRATRVPRQRLEMAMPNWQEELKQFEKEMKAHPQQEAPLPPAESTPVPEAAAPEASAKKSGGKPEAKAPPSDAGTKPAARRRTTSGGAGTGSKEKTSGKTPSKKSK